MSLGAELVLVPIFFAIAYVSVMVGIGGGLFYTTALLLGGFSIGHSVSISLACIALASASAAWRYWRKGVGDARVAVVVAASSAISALTLGWAVEALVPAKLHLYGFFAFAGLVFLVMLKPTKNHAKQKPSGVAVPQAAAIGFVAGAASASFGVGGGVVIVPALHSLCGVSVFNAAATSVISLPFTAVVGFIGHLLGSGAADAMVDVYKLLPLVISAAAGAFIGSRTVLQNERLRANLRKLFLVLLAAMLVVLAIREFVI